MTENQNEPEYRDVDEPDSTKEADERVQGDGGDAVNDPNQEDDQDDDDGEGDQQQ